MSVSLTASEYARPGDIRPAEDPVKEFLRGCTTGYLLKKGEILIGPRERSVFKTKRGAEKLLINHNGMVVKVFIMQEFPHPDMRD